MKRCIIQPQLSGKHVASHHKQQRHSRGNKKKKKPSSLTINLQRNFQYANITGNRYINTRMLAQSMHNTLLTMQVVNHLQYMNTQHFDNSLLYMCVFVCVCH